MREKSTIIAIAITAGVLFGSIRPNANSQPKRNNGSTRSTSMATLMNYVQRWWIGLFG